MLGGVAASATLAHIACPPTDFTRAGAIMGHVPRSACSLCPPGVLCDANSERGASSCPAGYFCPAGTVAPSAPVPHMASGFRGPLPCSPGSYCPSGSAVETPCPLGWYCPTPSLAVPCPAGTYQAAAGIEASGTPCLPYPLGRHAAHPGASACTISRMFDAVFLLSQSGGGGGKETWPTRSLDRRVAVWFAAAQRVDTISGDCLTSHITALEAFVKQGWGAHALIVEDDVAGVSDGARGDPLSRRPRLSGVGRAAVGGAGADQQTKRGQ